MITLDLLGPLDAGRMVTHEHFSGNIVFTRNTHAGTPDTEFLKAISELDIGILRYPAGQPDVAYLDGLVIEGNLPQHLINFLESARENQFKAVIVTPTVEAYRGPDELREFVSLVMQDYGDLIHSFEIGNEYWNHVSEDNYGRVANESILAVSDALSELSYQPEIWIQMADAAGAASTYHEHGGTWLERNRLANENIIDKLSTRAKSEIDGLVEHFYMRDNSTLLNNMPDQHISRDHQIWQEALQRPIPLYLTEWNIRTTNLDQLGMKAASSLLAHFTHILELGVAEAYVWSPQHSTSTDLAGADEVIIDPDTGHVVNSVGGAIFDLMSTSLPGKRLLESRLDNAPQDLQVRSFASETELVVYVFSRSIRELSFDFELGEEFGGLRLREATKIGYDKSSSDGSHYNYQERGSRTSDSVTVRSEDYFLNEHDVRANTEVIPVEDLDSPNDMKLSLDPFELIELRFERHTRYIGTGEKDRFQGTSIDEHISTFGDDDVIYAGGGQDTIISGSGDDYVDSGADADSVRGEVGDDTIRGWGGSDTLSGGAGHDLIYGWNGADHLFGGSGDDQLIGELGGDTIWGGDGSDTLNGGPGMDSLLGELGDDHLLGGDGPDHLYGFEGDDYLYGGSGSDIIIGGDGADYIVAGQDSDEIIGGFGSDSIWGQAGSDLVNGSSGDDLLVGGLGEDTLMGGEGTDRLWGSDGHDALSGGASPDHLVGGSGNDAIDGGAGDDMMWGQSGDDTLYGGSGDDVIVAGSGRTAILPGEGNDTVFAGDGADHIYIEERSGWDQIYNFQDSDLLDFSGSNLFGRLSDLIHRVYDDGENTRINVSEDVGVMLIGVTTSNLTLDNFSV